MAEDAEDENEKEKCFFIWQRGQNLEILVLRYWKIQGVFPAYVVRMAKLGQETGTLDRMMKSLSDYYGRKKTV